MTNAQMKALLKQAMATMPPGETLHIAAVIGMQSREIKRLREQVLSLQDSLHRTSWQWLDACRDAAKYRKAVEWALLRVGSVKLSWWQEELASRAGLRWNSKASKWVRRLDGRADHGR